MQVRIVHATARHPGAIAILQLLGDCQDILATLTGQNDWPLNRMRLVRFADIDEGLAVRLSNDVAQLMPHAGPRVVQRLTARLIELGAELVPDSFDHSLDPQLIYSEARDQVEALMLHALARAESPLAIDLLLDQPRRWREFHQSGRLLTAEDRARSHRLNCLITPVRVVLAGRPNVGKSTLSNLLLGRSMSIALDQPGTTRDYTAGRIDFAGLVVDWHDTPGLRESADPIERRAIALSQRLIAGAELLIAIRDPEIDWPDLPRQPHLWVINKIDSILEGRKPGPASLTQPITAISAQTGAGIAAFVTAIRDALVPTADLASDGPWLFDPRLDQLVVAAKTK